MERLLIIDSNSILNRAYFALPPMITKEGQPTSAIYGYLTMLNKICQELKPDHIVATFDRKAPTFRHQSYDKYKAGRKGMDDDLVLQLEPMKEILQAMAISIFEIDGFEADDLIGTISLQGEEDGLECFILSGDRDMLQLASDQTKVVITRKGITEKDVYDRAAFQEAYGITPKQFIDVKGFMGDKSDNIPGVPGIGEKTAFALISQYGSMEGVYQHIDEIKKPKMHDNLVQYQEDAFFSKKLATIMRRVPIDIDFEKIKSKEAYNEEKLRALYQKFEFRQLLNKLPKSDQPRTGDPLEEPQDLSYEEVDMGQDQKDLARGVDLPSLEEISPRQITTAQELAEAVGELDPKEPLYLSFLYEEDVMLSRREIKSCYLVSKEHQLMLAMEELLKEKAAKASLEELFVKDRPRVGYNVKNAYTILKKHGIHFSKVDFDVLTAIYLLEPKKGQETLGQLLTSELNLTLEGESDELRILRTMALKPLAEKLTREIEQADLTNLLYEVEQPLTNLLSDMELRGFPVDVEVLEEAGIFISQEIAKTQKQIYELAQEEFNISSPKQLGVVLFEKMDLPHGKKTKTGYSTSQDVLEKIKDLHPIVDLVLYYRQITKINSTYVEGLKKAIDKDGRIHSNFQQTLAVTGRLSSTDPNLQNIPVRQEMGRKLRKAFVPMDEDSLLFSSDYSQIELRVLAHMSDDGNMQKAFASGVDIHQKTAAEVFGKPLEEVTPRDRSNAKAVNFGIVYGMGDFSLSQDLGISRAEAKEYIERYYARYPNVRNYFDETIQTAKAKGYVTTICHRRRQIPEINARNKMVQALGVRLAMNSPIQGSAADIMKIAMLRVDEAIKKAGLSSEILLQVHDEIIINMKKDEEATLRKIVDEAMESAMDLKVALKSEQNIGANWYDTK